MQFQKIKDLMVERLSNDLSEKLYYHGVHHTLDVLEVCEAMAQQESLSESEHTLLCTAAVLHDCGFLNVIKEHEKEGVAIAKALLPDFGYSKEDIDAIAGMIMATKIPQQPNSKLEQIICDADLDYLGRDDFYLIGNKLFLELEELGVVKNEEEWDALQIKFLSSHTYHTAFAAEHREPKKQQKLNELKKKWKV